MKSDLYIVTKLRLERFAWAGRWLSGRAGTRGCWHGPRGWCWWRKLRERREERDHPCSHASQLSTTGDSADEKSGRAGHGGCVPTISKYNIVVLKSLLKSSTIYNRQYVKLGCGQSEMRKMTKRWITELHSARSGVASAREVSGGCVGLNVSTFEKWPDRG